MQQLPLPPPETSDEPDSATEKFPDYTGDTAGNRVFHFKLGPLKYGTEDKGHAAALILSVLLLFVIFVFMIIGTFASNTEWISDVFVWLGSAFLIVSGVAIGKSIDSK